MQGGIFEQPSLGAGGTVTSVAASGGTTGLSFTGSPITTTGTLTLTGTLAAVNGGTGQTVYAVGDTLYANTTTTLAKLPSVAVGSYLRSGGVGIAPLWSTLLVGNSATAQYVRYATATNTLGESINLQFTGTALLLGNPTPTAAIFDIKHNTGFMAIRSLVGTSSQMAIYMNQTVHDALDFALTGTLTTTTLNATGSVRLAVNSGLRVTVTNTAITFTPAATSSGVVSPFVFTGASNTNQTASVEAISVNFNLSATIQHATGALATQRAFVIQTPTYSFVGASTITDAVTFSAAGGPIAGTNATITNNHAIRIASNNVAGAGTTVNSYGLTVNAQTGATNNYAAQFIGGAVLFRGSTENNRVRIAKTLFTDTTNATLTELTSDGAAGSGSSNRIEVPLNMGMSVVLNIVAKQSGSANTKQFLRQFVIVNNGGTTSIEGVVTVLGTDIGSAGLATAAVTITANDTDDCVKVEATGVAATNIRWTSHIISTEAIYA